jgi:23S rRNA (guanosine2251-2'-O)-methyltransferase
VWLGGRRAVHEALRAGRAVELVVASGSASAGPISWLLDEAASQGVPTTRATRGELDGLVPGHQGVAARVRLPKPLAEHDLAAFEFGADAVVVVLDGITDPQNLGAAARSAEAAGALLLVTRERRAAAVTPAAVRASAGALLHLPHAVVTNLTRALTRLQDLGFTVVGLDEEAPTTMYDVPAPEGRLAVVVGSEGQGLSRLVREGCDLLVRIPMAGSVASLNASASLAAALYAFVLPPRRAHET